MKAMPLEPPNYSRVFLPLILFVTLAEIMQKMIAALHPEDHWLEWLACFGGALTGLTLFNTKNPWKFASGLFTGYLIGLFAGKEVAARFGFTEPLFGHFLAATAVPALQYIITNFKESVDYVIEKGAKIVGLLGDETIMKGLNYVKSWFKKGDAGGTP